MNHGGDFRGPLQLDQQRRPGARARGRLLLNLLPFSRRRPDLFPMVSRPILIVPLILASLGAFSASVAAQQLKEKSHVERFSSPEVRAERDEATATANLGTNASDDQALNARALARMRLGRYKEAYDDLRRAVSIKPANSDYQANLGYVLWKLGQPDEAIAAERAALKLNPKNTTAHYQLGRFLLRMGEQRNLAEAVAELRKALELDPRQYEVRFELIAAYRELGSLAEAAAQLDVLQDARPTDPRVFYVTALLDTDRNDLNSAVKNFNEAINRDPSLSAAWQDLGIAYMKANRWSEAVTAFAELARRQPNSVEAAYFHALALYNSDKNVEAEAEVRRALRLDAGAVEAHTLLGIILASRGNANTEAVDALSQAIALNPNSFDAQFYLGRVQYAMKDYAGAVKSFRAALKINPQHAEAHFFLGTTLELAGDSNAAMTEYQELLKSNSNSVMGQLGLGALLVKQGKLDEAESHLARETIAPRSARILARD